MRYLNLTSVLKYRSDEIEIMDDLSISGEVVPQTLKELDVINRRLGGNRISVQAFQSLIKEKSLAHVADLGCGGGDLMKAMARWSRKRNLTIRYTGFDANPNIVAFARNNTKSYPEIEYRAVNILDHDFKEMSFDVIHCCRQLAADSGNKLRAKHKYHAQR